MSRPLLPLVLLVLLALTTTLTACDATPIIRGVTRLGDTYDQVGPYTVLAEVDDPDGVDLARLYYQPGAASHVEVEMTQVSDGIFEGHIAGQPAVTEIAYFVLVDDSGASVSAPADALGPTRGRYRFTVLGRSCSVSLDCEPGQYCDHAGNCLQSSGPCKKDEDCGKGFRCDATGSCRLTFRSCVLDEGCLMGEVCDMILNECVPRPSCSATEPCPLDFSCSSALGLCLRSCMGASDCGPGESCGGGICSGGKACTSKADCAGGLACDPLLKVCRPEGASLCAACARDADCGGSTDFCILYSSGQFCGRDCSVKACPTGYTCNSKTVPPQCTPTSGTCS